MIDKDPQNWSLITWGLAILMSAGGGFVNWWTRVKAGLSKPNSMVELAGEIFTSGFTGVGVFMLFASFDQPIAFCASSAGVGGHMATRLLFAVEKAIERKLEKL